MELDATGRDSLSSRARFCCFCSSAAAESASWPLLGASSKLPLWSLLLLERRPEGAGEGCRKLVLGSSSWLTCNSAGHIVSPKGGSQAVAQGASGSSSRTKQSPPHTLDESKTNTSGGTAFCSAPALANCIWSRMSAARASSCFRRARFRYCKSLPLAPRPCSRW